MRPPLCAGALRALLGLAVVAGTLSIAAAQLSSTFTVGLYAQPCTLLANEAGLTGCQDPRPQTGILYRISTATELANFLALPASGDWYAPALTFDMFTPTVMSQLLSSGVPIAGVAVVPLIGPRVFSPATPCPNCAFVANASSQQPTWNPQGTSLAAGSYGIPMTSFVGTNSYSSVTSTQIQAAVAYNVAQRYASFPLYALQFNALMYAAGSALQCLNPQYDPNGAMRCDPIGGQSAWASFNVNGSLANALVVTTQLDATSFFHDLAVGAGASVGALVGMLAMTAALSLSPTAPSSWPRPLALAAFNADVWDLSGSRRFVQDLASFQCSQAPTSSQPSTDACPGMPACLSPCRYDTNFTRLPLGQLSGVLSLDQLLGVGADFSGASVSMYTHVAPGGSPLLASLLQSASVSGVTVQDGSSNPPALPPTAVQPFLAANAGLTHAVFTDYNDAYISPFYMSDVDDGTAWNSSNAQLLCNAAQVATDTVYRWANNLAASDPVPAAVLVNCTSVTEMLTCFTRNNSCTLFSRVLSSQYALSVASSVYRNTHYSGVYTSVPSIFAEFVRNWLLYYTSPLVAYGSDPTAANQLVYNLTSGQSLVGTTINCSTTADCAGAVMFQAPPPGSSLSAVPLGLICVLGRCVSGLSTYHAAYPLGLSLDEGSGIFSIVNASAGIWAESRWSSGLSTTLLLLESYSMQIMQLCVGLAVSLIGVGGSWFLVRRLHGLSPA